MEFFKNMPRRYTYGRRYTFGAHCRSLTDPRGGMTDEMLKGQSNEILIPFYFIY